MNLLLIPIFLILLSSTQGTVYVYPLGGVVSTPGGNASFQCISTIPYGERGLRIQWLMNESVALVNETIGRRIAVAYVSDDIPVLRFTEIPLEFNQTKIQCNASLSSGNQFVSEIALLQLQDILSAVGSLKGTLQDITTFLTWTAPFTLDMRDISYCVGVVNSTFSISATLHSECGITETEYEYPIPPDSACHDHMVTVTPVNAAGSGTASHIHYSQILKSPQVLEVASNSIDGTDIILYHIIMSDIVCNVEVTIYGNSDESITLLNSDLTIMLTNVSFTSEKLRLNRKYRIMVNASNINGSSVFSGDISSHDIVETGIHMNPLRIQTQYLLNSQAAGGLFSFLFITDNSVINFTKSTYLCLEKNTSQSYVLPFTQSPERYEISAYDIEEDGLLYSGEAYPATTSTHHDISGPGPSTSSEIEDCDVISDEQVVCVQCSFPPNSTCLGFLVVVQRDSISKARTLLVNTTQPGQALGPVTVEVEEGGVYQVTVFAIRGEMGIVGSAVEYSTQIEILAAEDEETGTNIIPRTNITIIGIGTGLGVSMMMVMILGGVILAFLCRRGKTTSGKVIRKTQVTSDPLKGDESSSTVQGSLVYEEIENVRDTFNCTQNLLYGKFSSEMTSDQNVGMNIEPSITSQAQDHEYEQIKACTYIAVN